MRPARSLLFCANFASPFMKGKPKKGFIMFGFIAGICFTGIVICVISERFDVKVCYKNSKGEYKDLNW